MKKTAIEVLVYVATMLVACILPAVIILPAMKSGDCPIRFQILLVAIISGFYILLFAPFVILAEVLARKIRNHHLLPLLAFPVFGAGFGVLALLMPPPYCWPEEPTNMNSHQIFLFLCLALLSIGISTLLMRIKK